MLNLLIVSNSPKAQTIVDSLRPLVKATIISVADFDHGLKDVFEKRPALVIIQEIIAGVTGESVARHIQLLFGSGAPKFILLHESKPDISAIAGLFDHVIDLNRPDEELIQAILAAMRQLLGTAWEIPATGQFVSEATDEPDVDFFAIKNEDTPPALPGAVKPEIETLIDPVAVIQPERIIPEKRAGVEVKSPSVKPEREQSPPQREKRLEDKTVSEPARAAGRQKNSGSAPGNSPDDILQAFNANYRAQKNRNLLISLALLVLVALGAGYVLLPRHWLPGFLAARNQTAQPAVPPASQPPAEKPVVSQPVQKNMPDTASVQPRLPAFVSSGTLDKTFSERKPGWERYTGANRDVRIFRQGGKIKALQVIAGQGRMLDESLLKTAMKELTGTDVFGAVTQRNQGRLLLQSARVGASADLLVYRDERSRGVKAFVLSVD